MEKLTPYLTSILWIWYAFTAPVLAQDLEKLAKEKPVSFSGGLSARAIFYSAEGIENRREPFSYVFTGSPVLSLYGFTIPFYFVYSEQERSFRQPFNQFGMSPRYKWITVHAGYRNISYSPFTMAGHTILGAGVDLNPGIFRFGFMYGRLNKATAIDTTSGSFAPFTYTRKGYAAKIGIGKGGNFLDLSFLKAADDSTSIGANMRSAVSESGGQSITPAENLVLGVSSRLAIKGFFLEADGGLSFYTNNLGSSIEAPESLPDVITGTVGSLITVNGSTEFFSAYNVGVGYRIKSTALKLQYRRIDPGYKSMGAYFLNNDVENITISPSFSLFQQKVIFSGSLGFQEDNLQKQKEATSKRVIGSGNLSINFNEKLSVDASFTNFSTSQRPARFYVSDTFLITQTTKNVSVSPRLMLMNTSISHVFLFSWNYMDLSDLSKIKSVDNEMEATNLYLNYQAMFNAQNLTLYINLNTTKLKMQSGTTGNQGVTIGGTKAFLNNKFSLGLNASFLTAKNLGVNSFLINSGLQASYNVDKYHSFNLNINQIGNYPESDETTENPSFSELRGEVAYMLNF